MNERQTSAVLLGAVGLGSLLLLPVSNRDKQICAAIVAAVSIWWYVSESD